MHRAAVLGLSAALLCGMLAVHFLQVTGSIVLTLPWSPLGAWSLTKPAGNYLVGVGKADITGPVVEINLMGYADPAQTGTGLRQRLYARAFIAASPTDPEERVAYLVLDTQSGDTAIRHGILDALAHIGGELAVYRAQNVAITGTHSHSGPGAWLNYLLPQVTSLGFDKGSYEAVVNGSVLAIQRAHESLRPGRLETSSGEILDANTNRSPFAYLANPEKERRKYEHDVDKTMSILKFIDGATDTAIGVLTWFAVHGTSMLGNNTMISGDNKGVAASLFEKDSSVDKSGNFVAGFSQSNVGDTSPNVLGAFCEDSSGLPCSFERSLCANNKSEACHGRGPFFGLDDGGAKSCFEIGRRQYEGALNIFKEAKSTAVQGPIRSLHTFRDFSNYTFSLANGTAVTTCSAALGYSFAAGTTDGPGAFDFKQHSKTPKDANPFWAFVSKSIHAPTKEQIACQAPKPILLDAGATTTPYAWAPNIVDVQVMRIGNFVIIVAPGEATTMAGRRWRDAIAEKTKKELGIDKPVVVLGGPANTYSHYIATEEEYGIQRYEGASTLYGPHTLAAWIHVTSSVVGELAKSAPARQRIPPGPMPPLNANRSLSFIRPVVFDRAGLFHDYGQIVTDVDASRTYTAGETIKATFIGANPRNNLKLQATFAAVEKQVDSASDDLRSRGKAGRGDAGVQQVQTVLDDSDWELQFQWARTSTIAGTSEATVQWTVGSGTAPGTYRLAYFGDAKQVGGRLVAFEGRSTWFTVE